MEKSEIDQFKYLSQRVSGGDLSLTDYELGIYYTLKAKKYRELANVYEMTASKYFGKTK